MTRTEEVTGRPLGALQPQARPVACKRHHGQEVFGGDLRGWVYQIGLALTFTRDKPQAPICKMIGSPTQACVQGKGPAQRLAWQGASQCSRVTATRLGISPGIPSGPSFTSTHHPAHQELHNLMKQREYWSELVNFAILGLPGNNFVKKKRKQIIGLGHREGSLAVLRAGLWAQNRFGVRDLDKQESTVPDDGMTFPCPQGRNVQASSTSTCDTNAILLTPAGSPALLAAREPAFPTTPRSWSREAHSPTPGSTAQRHRFLLWLPFSSQRQRRMREKASPPSGSPGRKAESTRARPLQLPRPAPLVPLL
ncbi:uncharacterized protein LOC114890890 [Monodon monoceros]|uniref:uncharacterized protein LOC114890890 n=1 Tax=Monodon monoceros TaxID=40151 RepID=UPI0010F63559|nr:uncharacterized protein LOC114890890 [Monodon monoceros]